MTAASLTPAWSKLVKDAQAYAAAHPERKEAIFREMAAIAELVKANKAAEAKPRMDRVQAMLDAPPPTTTGAPAGAVAVTARWSTLVKQMQAAAATNPGRKADMVTAAAAIQDALRSGKLDVANKLMETVEATLQENPREKEYRARYQALKSRLSAALQDPASDASRLRAMNAFIIEKANARDFETAMTALLNLEAALATAPAIKPDGPPAPASTIRSAF